MRCLSFLHVRRGLRPHAGVERKFSPARLASFHLSRAGQQHKPQRVGAHLVRQEIERVADTLDLRLRKEPLAPFLLIQLDAPCRVVGPLQAVMEATSVTSQPVGAVRVAGLDAVVQLLDVLGCQRGQTQRTEFGQDIAVQHRVVFGPGLLPQSAHILSSASGDLRHGGRGALGVPHFHRVLADVHGALEAFGLFACCLHRPVWVRPDREPALAPARQEI